MRRPDPLVRLLVRLLPRPFRRRFGREVERTASEALSARPGVRSTVFVTFDLVRTLARAWTAEGAEAVGRGLESARVLAGRALQDARCTVRGLRRTPTHGFVVVATLALAIGANAAVFTVTRALLLRPLPYDEPERIVRIDRGQGLLTDGALHPMLVDLARFSPDGGANLVEGSGASRVRITQVSGSFFPVMGVEPLIGPGLPADDVDGDPAAVLAYGLWRQMFGGDPSVVGRTLPLSGVPVRIAGVAPPDMEFPAGTQIWVSRPLRFEFYGAAVANYTAARLGPGTTWADLSAEQRESVRARIAAGEIPEDVALPEIVPLRHDLTASVRLPLLVLSAAAGLILLLGCLNVAGLTLARLWSREDELVVRLALGAGRGRILAQLLVEAATLAALGGAASLALARVGVPLLRALLPAETPGLAAAAPDGWLVMGVTAATVAAGLLSGVVPALVGVRRARAATVGSRATQDRRHGRLQASLAAAQLALAVVLVTGAALLGQSLGRLGQVPLGFDEDVLTFEVSLPPEAYPDQATRDAYRRRLEERIEALPGVTVVAASSRLPLASGLGIGGRLRVEGWPLDESVSGSSNRVSASYFAAMGIPLLDGPGFGAAPDPDTEEIVVDESLARALFPDGGAVGRTVEVRFMPEPVRSRIVGVAADVRARGPEQEGPSHTYYQGMEGATPDLLGFIVRSEGAPRGSGTLAAAVRAAAAEIDPTVPPFRMQTTGEAVATTLAARSAVALLSGLFGAAAAVLAGLGVYGVVAQGVARRRRELGIRLALGAEAGDLVRSTLASGARLAAAGIVAGAVGALWGTRLLEGLLFGIGATDPAAFTASVVGLGVVALIASYLPARRASRTDPLESLRSE